MNEKLIGELADKLGTTTEHANDQAEASGARGRPIANPDAPSPTMKALRDWIQERGGSITRFPGGFWTVEPWGQKTWGTSSVEALVRRGALEYCDWKENRNGRFPIRARMTPNVKGER